MGNHRKTRKKRTAQSPRVLINQESEFRLPPENDLGNVEYKVHLVEPSKSRLQHLATQLKWRLNEGQGEAIYELGVLDDGRMHGLEPADLQKTLDSLRIMTNMVGASLYILNDRCVYGEPSNPNCRRVVEVLVKKLPEYQPFADTRASCGKSSLCGVLTQGDLDNGHGSSRLNFLRYLHEIRSGKTSSITIDCIGFTADGKILNYKESDLKGILERASKLITLIDLAGDHKFLKTTIYGLSGYAPDYCAILINSKIGWNSMTSEHLTIASAFNIPIFFVISKIDLVKQDRVEKIIGQIQSAIERNHNHLKLKHILTEDECMDAANSINNNILPVFTVSNVSGENLNLLTQFLNLLPERNAFSAGSDKDARPLFYIDEIFNLPESGLVLCGLVANGVFNEADQVQIGPDNLGNYRLATIKSIRRNKQPVLKIHAGETASIAVQFSNGMTGFTIRKGMVVVSKHDFGICCKKFKANFKLISHSSGEICAGFQGVAYVASLKRAVTISNIEQGTLRPNAYSNVTFEFCGGPEFVKPGSRIFFKEQDTKGVGEVTEIPES